MREIVVFPSKSESLVCQSREEYKECEGVVDMSDNDQKTTPMLETLLERINALTTEFQSFRSTIEQRLTGIEEEMRKGHAEIREEMNKGNAEIREEMNKGFADVREEMNQGFRKIDRRLDAMSGDIHKLRGDVNYLEGKMEKLVEKLEQQPA